MYTGVHFVQSFLITTHKFKHSASCGPLIHIFIYIDAAESPRPAYVHTPDSPFRLGSRSNEGNGVVHCFFSYTAQKGHPSSNILDPTSEIRHQRSVLSLSSFDDPPWHFRALRMAEKGIVCTGSVTFIRLTFLYLCK